jgi:hypothetical protein
MKKIILFLTFTVCLATRAESPNTIIFDHNDKNARKKLIGKSPEAVEALLGAALRKGYTAGGSGTDKRTFKLVYLEVGQAIVSVSELDSKIINNSKDNVDTGYKCVAINFDQENGFKFKEGGAAIDWNYDCIVYKNLSGHFVR